MDLSLNNLSSVLAEFGLPTLFVLLLFAVIWRVSAIWLKREDNQAKFTEGEQSQQKILIEAFSGLQTSMNAFMDTLKEISETIHSDRIASVTSIDLLTKKMTLNIESSDTLGKRLEEEISKVKDDTGQINIVVGLLQDIKKSITALEKTNNEHYTTIRQELDDVKKRVSNAETEVGKITTENPVVSADTPSAGETPSNKTGQ